MQLRHSFIYLLFVLFLLFVFILPTFSCKLAQEKQKDFVIGIINPNTGTQDINRGFVEGLADYGFIEGQNTVYIRAESSYELDKVIQDMVARNVNLIFTVTTPATRTAKEATQGKNIPVVYAMQDPVESGLIKSLARPSGYLTGVQIRGSVPKTVEWMRLIAPDCRHFFVPVKYDTKAVTQSLEDLQKTAGPLGIKLTLAEVNDQDALDKALAAIPDDVDAIFVLCSIFIHSNVEKLVQAAIEKQLLIGSGAAQSDRGVTVSYGMIAEKTGRQAGRLASLVLNGKAPSDVPSEITDFFLGVNLKTAGLTGVEIPVGILLQADVIIR